MNLKLVGEIAKLTIVCAFAVFVLKLIGAI